MKERYKHLWKVAGIVAAMILLYTVLQNFRAVEATVRHFVSAFFPLILGGCIAFVLNIPMSRLEKLFDCCPKKWVLKIKRPISLLLSIVIILTLIYLVVDLVVPELINGMKILIDSLSTALDKFNIWWEGHSDEYPQLAEFLQRHGIDIYNLKNSLMEKLQGMVPNLLSNTVSIITGGIGIVVNIVMALVFALYILAGKERLGAQVARTLGAFASPKTERRITHIASTTYWTFAKFVVGQCTEAIILGSLCAIGMLVFRMPYAVMIGALVGATALIPIVGAFIGAAVGAFMIAMVDPWSALWFVAFLLILQQIEGNLIYPRVVGSSVGLPAIWVFASVTVGGGLGGLGGMLFAVPTVSVCYKLIMEQIDARQAMKTEGGTASPDATGPCSQNASADEKESDT